MSTILERINEEQMRQDLPEFRPGDTVAVHIRIVEGNKERIREVLCAANLTVTAPLQ